MSSETTPMSTRKRKSRAVETLAKWKECNVETKRSGKANIGSKRGCMKGKGGPQNSLCKFRGVRQRTSGKWVAEIREPNGGNRLWLGTFTNAVEAARAYDEAAKTMYISRARLNFPANAETNTPNNTIQEDLTCPVMDEDEIMFDLDSIPELFNDDYFKNLGSFFDDGQLGCLDVDQYCGKPSSDDFFENMGSTTTSNNSAVFAVEVSTHVSPNLRNEDVTAKSTAFADNHEATSVVQDIAHISPNVKNEVGKGDLGDIPELPDDDFFSDIVLPFQFDFDDGHLGLLGDDQCGKPSDLTDSCKIQMTSC